MKELKDNFDQKKEEEKNANFEEEEKVPNLKQQRDNLKLENDEINLNASIFQKSKDIEAQNAKDKGKYEQL